MRLISSLLLLVIDVTAHGFGIGANLVTFPRDFDSQNTNRAGVILNYKDRYLLVQNKFSFRWSFTKGHVEPFDVNLLETAQREVKEESGYLEHEHYVIDDTQPRIYGKSTYWTGTVISPDPPKLKEDEHLGFGWFTKDEMRKLKTTTDITEWL